MAVKQQAGYKNKIDEALKCLEDLRDKQKNADDVAFISRIIEMIRYQISRLEQWESFRQ